MFTVVIAEGVLLQVPSLATTVTLNTVPHLSCVSVQVVLEEAQESEGIAWLCMKAWTKYTLVRALVCHDTVTAPELHRTWATTL